MPRHMTYQFEWGFVTIDTRDEQEPDGYLAKFPTTVDEREIIDEGAQLEVVGDELVITPVEELE